MAYNNLNPEEKKIIEDRGTEMPFSGEYDSFYQAGIFICRRCNTPLFSSKAKFDAGCGWPAFDDSFPGAVSRLTNLFSPGTEIECAHCHAHLGHVFEGEKFTDKDTRHCVNSLAIRFIKEGESLPEIKND